MAEMLAFCDLLTARERATGRLGNDEEYRLPAESEWERAAMAGARTRFAHGDEEGQLHWYAWYDTLAGPHPVAQKLPNRWGFYDMSGNVIEILCEHKVHLSGKLQRQHWMPIIDIEGGWKDWYAARGGSWNMGAIASEPTMRRAMHPLSRTSHMGFRLACGPVLPEHRQGDPKPDYRWSFVWWKFRQSQAYARVMQSAPATWPRPTGWTPPPAKAP
jgi:formylglycine-generating enzyme required for sulfatase activity